jgi:hypothetical protein
VTYPVTPPFYSGFMRTLPPARPGIATGSAHHGTLQERDWVALPGGELEAPRLRVLCSDCRERLTCQAEREQRSGEARQTQPLCFGCYREQLRRDRQLEAARDLNTASEARFQYTLPFEPVNRARLNQLRAARQAVRASDRQGVGRFVDRRRRAQMAARHVLQRLAEGLSDRNPSEPDRHARMAAAAHAAELQLPDAWLPFVLSR